MHPQHCVVVIWMTSGFAGSCLNDSRLSQRLLLHYLLCTSALQHGPVAGSLDMQCLHGNMNISRSARLCHCWAAHTPLGGCSVADGDAS
jgi:hypothetical protein